ncbi:hypothetical protein DFP73DRAFT_539007 [Morchella snyderi]|nr:hypothetical protein DFP73DRAFT_539007 [Morchella snyderi]
MGLFLVFGFWYIGVCSYGFLGFSLSLGGVYIRFFLYYHYQRILRLISLPFPVWFMFMLVFLRERVFQQARKVFITTISFLLLLLLLLVFWKTRSTV